MGQPTATTADTDVASYYRTIAPFYDRELSNRGDEAFFEALGRAYSGKSILELGAGSGRVTGLLARYGAEVVGVDISPDMLRRAQRRLRAMPKVSLIQGDMCDLTLSRHFDLVVAADDPFSHLMDDAGRDRALQVTAQHLKQGGQFVLDASWMRAADIHAAGTPEGKRVVRRAADGLVVQEHWHCATASHECTAEYRYEVDGVTAATARFRSRYWTLAEVEQRFARAGLRVAQRWGNYDRSAWTPASRHLIVSAQHSVRAKRR